MHARAVLGERKGVLIREVRLYFRSVLLGVPLNLIHVARESFLIRARHPTGTVEWERDVSRVAGTWNQLGTGPHPSSPETGREARSLHSQTIQEI